LTVRPCGRLSRTRAGGLVDRRNGRRHLNETCGFGLARPAGDDHLTSGDRSFGCRRKRMVARAIAAIAAVFACASPV
jgi:hypothetical protein